MKFFRNDLWRGLLANGMNSSELSRRHTRFLKTCNTTPFELKWTWRRQDKRRRSYSSNSTFREKTDKTIELHFKFILPFKKKEGLLQEENFKPTSYRGRFEFYFIKMMVCSFSQILNLRNIF
jgi:hypothetical protein